jgi:hypothetical protein
LAVDLRAFLDDLVCLPLIEGGATILRAFCSSALWQIYETVYHLFRVQKVVVLVPGVDPCSLQRPPIELDRGLMRRQR